MTNLQRASLLIQNLKLSGIIQEGDYLYMHPGDDDTFFIEVESNERNGWGNYIKKSIEEEFSEKEVTMRRKSLYNFTRTFWKDGFCFAIRERAH